jgi:hypothetical protein
MDANSEACRSKVIFFSFSTLDLLQLSLSLSLFLSERMMNKSKQKELQPYLFL